MHGTTNIKYFTNLHYLDGELYDEVHEDEGS